MKTRQHDARGTRSKQSVYAAMRALRRGGGVCPATRLPRYGDFGSAVAAALLAAPAFGTVQMIDCPDCSGFHVKRAER